MTSQYKPYNIDLLLCDMTKLEETKKRILESYSLVGECWNWTKGTSDRGRAIMKVGGRNHHTARVVYVVFNVSPVRELKVCHSCDNVLCVNPKHLWLGTHLDNMEDMSSKGRRDGEFNPKCKLTETDVVTIRKKSEEGLSQRKIGKIYGISHIQVGRIVNRESWDHI